MRSDLVIFLDSDGVLADLDRGLKTFLNTELPTHICPENKIVVDNTWYEIAAKIPHFWLDLPLMPDAKTLYKKVLEVHDQPYILTATPKCYEFSHSHTECAFFKKAWYERHFGPHQANRFIATKSDMKHRYISKTHKSILIDDSKSNIEQWNQAGGIGILYDSIDNVLEQLENLK